MTIRNLFVPFGLRPKKISEGTRYGDVNDRTMAAAIDVMLLYVLLGTISDRINEKVFALFDMQPLGYDINAHNWAALKQVMWEVRWPWSIANAILVLLMGVLIVTCQMAYGTTPGKWLLGLKIVRHGTLAPVARWRYVLRFFGYIVAGVPLTIGFLWMNFNKQRRGWHDYIAGTVVINTRPHGWLWQQVKRGYRKLRGRPDPLAVEQPVGEPAAEQGHHDGEQPVE
jgi:uncharacterized RDD family membrane protein YckC